MISFFLLEMCISARYSSSSETRLAQFIKCRGDLWSFFMEHSGMSESCQALFLSNLPEFPNKIPSNKPNILEEKLGKWKMPRFLIMF